MLVLGDSQSTRQKPGQRGVFNRDDYLVASAPNGSEHFDQVERTIIVNVLDGVTVPEQRKVLLENDVRVQLLSSEIIVRIGDEVGDHIKVPANLARRGNELKLVLGSNDQTPAAADPVLLKLITHALLAQQGVLTDTQHPIVSNYSKRHLWQLLRVSWLAPDIIGAIVEGRQPPTLTGRRLLRAADVPLAWDEQRRYFGFN